MKKSEIKTVFPIYVYKIRIKTYIVLLYEYF